jgi:hypothetical protein
MICHAVLIRALSIHARPLPDSQITYSLRIRLLTLNSSGLASLGYNGYTPLKHQQDAKRASWHTAA